MVVWKVARKVELMVEQMVGQMVALMADLKADTLVVKSVDWKEDLWVEWLDYCWVALKVETKAL